MRSTAQAGSQSNVIRASPSTQAISLMSSSALARIALVCIVCIFGTAWGAAEPAYSPAAVKAAFLHRFASYVEWPDAAANTEPFTIAVTGADEVAGQLEQLLPQLKIQNRRAQLRRVEAPEELDGVHILYIGPAATPRARGLLAAAGKLPILTITDDADGLASGSVINFVQVGRNIRFEVSLPAAERSRLRIDSGLLSVAARVEGQPRAGTVQKKDYVAHTKDRAPGYRERGRS
jgi:hypothetical protein